LYFVVFALPIGLITFWLGGYYLLAVVLLVIFLAAMEYVSLFQAVGYHPSLVLTAGGSLVFIITRYFQGFEYAHLWLSAAILCSMTYHLFVYEKEKHTKSGFDFTITLSGMLYFGWLGGYILSLRALPNGFWWLLLSLGTVWMVDIGGYTIGRPFGKRPFFPHLSPRKTWEGFAGGILGGAIGGSAVLLLWQNLSANTVPHLTYGEVIIFGIILALLTPLGDLGESMIKRQAGVKDSSQLIPGHGGMWDRIDSWLWSVCIGYYLITNWLL
jgi:phosphatidate cytidylyltransferase